MKKILIATAPYGAGHKMVTKALIDEFEKHDDVIYKEVDMFYEFFPDSLIDITKVTHKFSFMPVMSDIYGVTYKAIDVISPTWDSHIQGGVTPNLKKYLLEENFDAIIQTFPVKQLSNYKKRYQEDLKLFTVVTDYYAQGRWYTPNLDCIFVPSEKVKEDAIKRGHISTEEVLVSGIPVRDQFKEDINIQKEKEEFGLNLERKTVLFALGAASVSKDVFETISSLAVKDKYNIIVMCGSSQDALKKMLEIPNVKPIGFTTDVAKYFTMADLIISKAGGSTISEISSIGRGVIFTPPQPGQEEENAKYFTMKGAAHICELEDIEDYAVEILDSNRYIQMGKYCKKINNVHASEIIVRKVLEEI